MVDDINYIKVMADYLSTGLWDADGVSIDIELPPAIKNRLDKWCAVYDADTIWEASDSYLKELQTFTEEGKLIAQQIKTLMPNCSVWYFDEYLFASNEASKCRYEIM